VEWRGTPTPTRTRVSFGDFAVSLCAHEAYAVPGDRKNKSFLTSLSAIEDCLSTPGGSENATVVGLMWGIMWVSRVLMFPTACKLLKGVVAGEGFEPSTFGL
jgi:hypothetical protein